MAPNSKIAQHISASGLKKKDPKGSQCQHFAAISKIPSAPSEKRENNIERG
jgi:hypothetical protein